MEELVAWKEMTDEDGDVTLLAGKLFSREPADPSLYGTVLMMEVKSLTLAHALSLVSPYHGAGSVTTDL